MKAVLETHLMTAASEKRVVYYEELAPLVNVNMRDPRQRKALAVTLGEISTQTSRTSRRHMLSVIVLSKGEPEATPGQGFYKLARELKRLKPGRDERAFFCRELKRVFDICARERQAAQAG